MKIFKENTCENCKCNARRKFQIIEPNLSLPAGEELESWTFCTVACAKEFAAWMMAGGKIKMPKGWKVKEVKG